MAFKRFISLALCALLLFCLVGCADDDFKAKLFIAAEDKNENAQVAEYSEITTVADNGKELLQYDPIENRVNVTDKATGTLLWSTGVTEEEYGEKIVNKLTRTALKQMINIKYTDFGKKNAAVHNASDDCKTTVRAIKNGVRFDFNFSDIDIKLSLEFTLSEDGLSVYLPKSSIVEDGKYYITGIDILPMFAATKSDTDGYFLLPDGSGALYRFGSAKTVENNTLLLDIYDLALTDIDKAEDNAKQGICKASAPIFAVKHAQKSVFANITEGEENCSLSLMTDTGVYHVNRLYPTVRVRKQYSMITASGNEIFAYEKSENISDIRINYSFLSGEDCGYSAMASLYREQLIKTAGMQDFLLDSKSYPAAIDFLCGVSKDSMLLKQNVSTATFAQIESMLSGLKKGGVGTVSSILYGWQSGGYYTYPQSSKPSAAAGGKGALSSLIKSAEDTKFYLLQNYTNANKGTGGFSTYTDVVYKIDNIPLDNEDGDKYLLNLLSQQKRLKRDVKNSAKWGAGLAAEGFGSLFYEDYEKNRRITRTGFKSLSAQFLAHAKENGISTAQDGFAPYLLAHTDYVFNLPSKASNYTLLDESVPFLQMVLHGFVPYSDSVPGNLSDDLTETKLKWVEYGYMPTFMLTYENSDELKDTDFNLLFSSEYHLWKEKIASMCTEMEQKLLCTVDSAIISHSKQNGVATLKYENGTTVYVNYNDTPVTVNDKSVGANDYLVIAK